jgi:3-methyladenine DNA glycosylase Tag
MVKKRCEWVGKNNPLMFEYHDREWGVPVHDDARHFEFLAYKNSEALSVARDLDSKIETLLRESAA